MACFLVPATEAIVAGAVKKVAKSKGKVSFAEKLGWLTKLSAGGSVLLAYEHLWHGEIVPFPPFLTAMENAEDAAEMFHEMGTVGVTMAVIISLVWVGMLLVSNALEKRGVEDVKGVKS